MKAAASSSVFWFALCVMLAFNFSAWSQQTNKVPRIGYLSGDGDPTTPGLQVEAFRQGLRELGYVEGKNIIVEYRYELGKPERAPGLVAELIQLNVDVLVAVPSPAIRAAKQATNTIPIVMVTTADPVETGRIESLARPGGNVTGLTRLTRDLSGKRMELLERFFPAYRVSQSFGKRHLQPEPFILKSIRLQRTL